MNTLKIAIVGPESTGKTTLAAALAVHYQTTFVPEIARNWLQQLGRNYKREDLAELAKLQSDAEDALLANSPSILIADTTLSVIRIWSEYKYGAADPEIVSQEEKRAYDLTLLTDADLDWEADPLRENPNDRMDIFSAYYRHLIRQNRDFSVIFGHGDERFQRAVRIIDQMPRLKQL